MRVGRRPVTSSPATSPPSRSASAEVGLRRGRRRPRPVPSHPLRRSSARRPAGRPRTGSGSRAAPPASTASTVPTQRTAAACTTGTRARAQASAARNFVGEVVAPLDHDVVPAARAPPRCAAGGACRAMRRPPPGTSRSSARVAAATLLDAHVRVVEEDLPVQVRALDHVVVAQPERPHARARERHALRGIRGRRRRRRERARRASVGSRRRLAREVLLQAEVPLSRVGRAPSRRSCPRRARAPLRAPRAPPRPR